MIAKVKTAIKLKRFKSLAKVGSGLSVSASSNCLAEKAGLISIGDNCEICGTLISQENGKISIGDRTTIRFDSIVGSISEIVIGNDVIISNNVHIYDNNNHPVSPCARISMTQSGFHSDLWKWKHAACDKVIIEDNVWIGEFAAVLKGVTIGRGSVVASHSVVTKDVPPFSIVAGNPARVVKQIQVYE